MWSFSSRGRALADIADISAEIRIFIKVSDGATLNHVNFVMKILFPSVTEHAFVISKKLRLQINHNNYDAVMLQLEQLINNKYFVLTFIETMERQKSFNMSSISVV